MRNLLATLGCVCILTFVASPSPGQEEEPEWIEVRKLLASDGGGGHLFGDAAALDGDRLVVGAPRAAPGDTGAVYVFERHAGGPSRWGEVARLKPLDPVLADLGARVAIRGDTIAASAPTEGLAADGASIRFDYRAGGPHGAAYVFERRPDGTWRRIRLLPPDQPEGFGHGVATDGETVFVGSSFDDDAGSNAGAVYVYERDAGGPGNWGPVAKLTAADPVNQAYFGTAIAVDDGILVVGARRDGGRVEAGGAAHIFERSELGDWIEVAKLYPSDGGDEDDFGEEVAVDGATVVIGAHNSDNPVLLGGAVYVFERDGDRNWLEVAKLVSSDVEPGHQFGGSVAISGDTLIAGANGEDVPGSDSGAAYVFQRDAGDPAAWTERAKIEASDAHDIQNFGSAVAAGTGTVAVGAHGDDERGGSAGAAYVFRRADLDLTLSGTCPGTVSLSVTGADPRAPVGLLWSNREGKTILPPGGICEGMELGLEQPRVLVAARADGDGALALTREIAPGACGRFLQAVEVGICNPSNTVQLPPGRAGGGRR